MADKKVTAKGSQSSSPVSGGKIEVQRAFPPLSRLVECVNPCICVLFTNWRFTELLSRNREIYFAAFFSEGVCVGLCKRWNEHMCKLALPFWVLFTMGCTFCSGRDVCGQL